MTRATARPPRGLGGRVWPCSWWSPFQQASRPVRWLWRSCLRSSMCGQAWHGNPAPTERLFVSFKTRSPKQSATCSRARRDTTLSHPCPSPRPDPPPPLSAHCKDPSGETSFCEARWEKGLQDSSPSHPRRRETFARIRRSLPLRQQCGDLSPLPAQPRLDPFSSVRTPQVDDSDVP